MERGAWTDARLDDRFDQIDRRFDRVDAELGAIRGEIGELRTTMVRIGAGVGGGIIAGLLGVIAAVLSRGA
jgi:hypothetical protein